MFKCIGPPTLLGEIPDQKVELGQSLKVKIPIDSKLPVEVKIKKDGKEVPLDSQKHIKVATYDDYIVLQVCYECYNSIYIEFDLYSNSIPTSIIYYSIHRPFTRHYVL